MLKNLPSFSNFTDALAKQTTALRSSLLSPIAPDPLGNPARQNLSLLKSTLSQVWRSCTGISSEAQAARVVGEFFANPPQDTNAIASVDEGVRNVVSAFGNLLFVANNAHSIKEIGTTEKENLRKEIFPTLRSLLRFLQLLANKDSAAAQAISQLCDSYKPAEYVRSLHDQVGDLFALINDLRNSYDTSVESAQA